MAKRKAITFAGNPQRGIRNGQEETFNRLFLLPDKLVEGEPIDPADRRLLAEIVKKVVDDDNPAEMVWETLKHRSVSVDQKIRRDLASALYALYLRQGGKKGKVLDGKVASASGFTANTVRHLRRDSEAFERATSWANSLEMLDLQRRIDSLTDAFEQEEKFHVVTSRFPPSPRLPQVEGRRGGKK